MPELDPVLFEVLKHKILATVDEQAISLRAASGSPVVTESNDFNVGLYLPDGTAVAVGRYILTQAFTTGSIIKSIVSKYRENPGWVPGDMYLCNDPFQGSLHGQDLSVVAPLYHNGEQVGWVGCCAHQVDMGGMTFGSWCPQATERQQESMVLTPLKLVEGGRIRQDIWDMLLAGTRMPVLLGLDLRAMMSSNRLAQARYSTMIGRYGWGAVTGTMTGLVELAELRMRQRLLELPDGDATSTDYIDHDGHEDKLYRIRLHLKKRGDRLEFDFTGTSAQAPGFINCTYSGLVAGVSAGFSPLIAFDMPFNEGLLRPFTIRAPQGTLVNAIPPAPTSMASVGAVYAVTSVVVTALSRLLAASPKYRRESSARTRGAISIVNLSGVENGERFGTMLLDGLAGGGGAWPDHDGLHTTGTYSMLEPNIANVEMTENVVPILFLHRKLLIDSGGPGAQRGGLAVGWAFTPHRVAQVEAVLVSHGVGVPNATGLFGGYPGSCTANRLVLGSDVKARYAEGQPVLEVVELSGEHRDAGSKPGRFTLRTGDILACEMQGGGGYGDPFDRDPDTVAADIASGEVSEAVARSTYGVILENGQADRERTRLMRAGRHHRPAVFPLPSEIRIGHALFLDRTRILCACGADLGAAGGPWAVKTSSLPAGWSRADRVRPELELRALACPACGRFHEIVVAERGEAAGDDLSLSITESAQAS